MAGRTRVGILATGAVVALVSLAAVPARPRVARARSTAQTIAIDFFAVRPDGSPVTDLSAADVAVSLDGRPTPIRSLEWVREGVAPDAVNGAAGYQTDRVPSPFVTNGREPGVRSFYLIVDDDGADATFASALSRAAGALLATLPPQDTVALTTVRSGGANVPSTADRRAVTSPLATGLSEPRPPAPARGAPPATSRAARDGARVSAVLDALAGADTTSIVILVGRGLPPVGPESQASQASRERSTGVPGPFAAAREAEARARAHLFLADLAGGNDVLARVARETAAHYVATVMGDASPGLMPVTVSTSRAAVSVIARPLAASESTIRTGGDRSVAAVVDSRDEFRQATIRAAAFSSRASREKGTLAVSVAIEAASGTAPLLGAGAELVSATGSIVARTLAPPVSLATSPTVVSLVAPGGSYRVRAVGVVGDRAGSVDVPIDVGLIAAGPLRLGSLALGAPHAAAPAQTSPTRGGRVPPPVVPDVRLQFSSEREGVAFFDVYGGVANEHVSIVMEVLRRPDGPPVQLLQPTIQPARVGEPDHYLVTAPIDVGALTPGDYLVRATVSVAAQPPGVLTRTLRKVKAG